MKIKSIFLLLTICFTLTLIANAQEEIYHAEVYGGYLFNSIQTSSSSSDTIYVIPGMFETTTSSSSSRKKMHGFNFSVTGNSSKSVGWKFDFSHNRTTESTGTGTSASKIKYSLQQYLGGVQFKNNLKDEARFKPFAHVLAGIARQYVSSSSTGNSNSTQTDLAMLFGGGIDVKLNKRMDLRVIQFDYNPIFVKARNGIAGHTQHNFRIGFGLVFH